MHRPLAPSHRLRLARVSVAAVAAPLLVATFAGAAPALPPLPGPQTATTAQAQAASGATGPVATDTDQLRRGVVQVEQAGRPLAVGTVLARDGRVLTALSGLGQVTSPDIRYADGSVVKAKIAHTDKAWDLALLVPQAGAWKDGLIPTDVDPSGVELKAFLPKASHLAALGVGYKSRFDAKSKDGEALRQVFDVDLKGAPGIPGAPILEPNGRVVGVLVHACKDGGDKSDRDRAVTDKSPGAGPAAPACSPITIVAPVYALRGFLMKTPANAMQPAPWLGLGGAPSAQGNVKGVRIVGVAPGSPADKAGLKGGAPGEKPSDVDTIVAVDGAPVETPEQLAEAISKRTIGQTVKLLVFAGGKFREVPVTLRSAP